MKKEYSMLINLFYLMRSNYLINKKRGYGLFCLTFGVIFQRKLKQNSALKTHSLKIHAANDDEFDAEHVVMNWMEASSRFHTCYMKLVASVKEKETAQNLPGKDTVYIGQCPMWQLTALAVTMRTELEKLTQEIDQLYRQTQLTEQANYAKLADHTLILNQLNQQAQTRLHLIAQTAS